VGGPGDGENYPCGPPTLIECDGEKYLLTIDGGYLTYVAESARDAVRELVFRRYDRENEDGL
jgi:hypothetical protein